MKRVDPGDYLWIIVETRQGQESFFGVQLPTHGHVALAARTKEEAEELMGRLPQAEPGTTRQVEAIHREQLKAEAAQQGWGVRIVDAAGKILGEP